MAVEKLGAVMSKHPYEQYESSAVWRILDKSLEELIRNKDLKECTGREYIVGYLVKQLTEEGALKAQALTTE